MIKKQNKNYTAEEKNVQRLNYGWNFNPERKWPRYGNSKRLQIC